MDRIKREELDRMAELINKMTGSPCDYGVGNYYINRAYGGYCLERMSNESGGCSDVFRCGHVPARDLYNRMRAYIDGLEMAERLAAGK
jgi:hypothetical protein